MDLEQQVKGILSKRKWKVSSNLYYEDSITKKPREKDIIATLPQLENNRILNYNVRLFIECKNLSETTEIYPLENKNINDINNTILAYRMSFAKISEIERYKKLHFFNKYSQIFTAKDKRDFLYKSINQNLQSFAAFRKNSSEKGVYFLAIVYKGNIKYRDKNNNFTDCDRALIEIETLDNVFNLPNRRCFIELISVNQLEDYLKDIAENINEINSSMMFYYRKEQRRIEKNRRRQKRRFNEYI